MEAERRYLTEDQVVELMALFFSSALLLLREPARYGPLRQLTAAERLAAMALDGVSPQTRALLELAIARIPVSHTLTNHPEKYRAIVVELNEALGDCLVARAGLETGGAA